MNMPVVSGFEVVEYLKCKKDFFRTPIIMLSASGAQEDIQKAYDTGVDYYIKKPTDYKEMFTIIESISNWMDHRALAFR
jgi:CheY-like chemotaxis protein